MPMDGMGPGSPGGTGGPGSLGGSGNNYGGGGDSGPFGNWENITPDYPTGTPYQQRMEQIRDYLDGRGVPSGVPPTRQEILDFRRYEDAFQGGTLSGSYGGFGFGSGLQRNSEKGGGGRSYPATAFMSKRAMQRLHFRSGRR